MSVTQNAPPPIAQRFRGFLPVVLDLETSGFDSQSNAILELAAMTISQDAEGRFIPDDIFHYHIEPFAGAVLCPDALAFTKIDPDHPFRFAISERKALHDLFQNVQKKLRATNCQRAVLVAHNTLFDMSFLQVAIKRAKLNKTPFHAFTAFDTATLAGLALGQTVLAKACHAAGIAFDAESAHSALYDVQRTAELFCWIVNRWDALNRSAK